MQFGADVRARLAALPVFVLVVPWQCNLLPQPVDHGPLHLPAVDRKHEAPAQRVSAASPSAPRERMPTLPEAEVVRVMDTRQQSFLRCWERAQRSDQAPVANKVWLRLEIDERGRVTAIRSDSDSPVLVRCLSLVARGLSFRAPGRPAVVELPLIF